MQYSKPLLIIQNGASWIQKSGFFLNCVIEAETELRPEELFLFLISIGKKLHRMKRIRNGPRTIDIDILFYGNKIIKTKNLIVPHPRMHRRLFVLQPFNEINPDFMHPILKKNIKKLMKDLHSKKGVEIYQTL